MRLYLLFILVFSLGFLTACERAEISDSDLQDQLEKTTDLETLDKIMQIIQNRIQEKEAALDKVVKEIEKTTDQASCDKIKVEYNKLDKELYVLKGMELSGWEELPPGSSYCSEKGWTAPYNPSQ